MMPLDRPQRFSSGGLRTSLRRKAATKTSEHAVKGTDLSRVAGKEDPVEFDFKQNLCSDMGGVA